MENINFKIRVMKVEDYEQVYDLWMSIHGFGIRSIDDSLEGVTRFLKRNPTTSVVAIEDGKVVNGYEDYNAPEYACNSTYCRIYSTLDVTFTKMICPLFFS